MPPLPEELLEEIFLRLPPDEPAWLVRSSLASKLWLALLTGARFRGRYRDFHGAAPMLGFFHSRSSDSGPPFVPTAKSGAGLLHVQGCHKDYAVWDCRHGHVLLSKDEDMSPLLLVVWDPMTSRRRELHGPRIYDAHGAAVLCAVPGCLTMAPSGWFSLVWTIRMMDVMRTRACPCRRWVTSGATPALLLILPWMHTF